MKVRISDYGWGINRRTGEKSESLIIEESFNSVKKDDVLEVGPTHHKFVVKELKETSIVLTVNLKGDEAEIKVNGKYEYRPLSFDGGHYYVIEVEQ